MIGLWVKIKERWYRRQGARALWFLRYMDRVMHEMGLPRTEIRAAWRDFRESSMARRDMLNWMAAINKVKIRKIRQTQLQKAIVELRSKLSEINYEANMAKGKLAEMEAQAAAREAIEAPKTAPEEGVSH